MRGRSPERFMRVSSTQRIPRREPNMQLLVTTRALPNLPDLALAERAARRLLSDVGNPDAEISLLLTGDEEIQSLNRSWRGKDLPTDVLSWPQDDSKVLGDVAISVDTAERQAARRGWSVGEECALLLVHGILHLLGHEDDTESGSEEMKKWEREILGKAIGSARGDTIDPMTGTRKFPWRNKSLLIAFRHALDGVAHTFRTQRNMRVHYLLMILVLFAGLIVRLPRLEMIGLMFAASLVVLSEMFNTAIEAVVDMITDKYHPAAKYAKDVAAGAVLIAAVNAAVVGGMIFSGTSETMSRVRGMNAPPTIPMLIAALLLLLVVVLLGKILGVKGTLLKGGAISGHSAVAFFVATTIALLVGNVLIGVLALALAGLVGQSRIEGKIHSFREVVTGAVLAIALGVIVFRLPALLSRILP